tara:strand:- start:312 stop:521 length:210 start_codon:yes stop_codon:yes gene_type:complete
MNAAVSISLEERVSRAAYEYVCGWNTRINEEVRPKINKYEYGSPIMNKSNIGKHSETNISLKYGFLPKN